MRIRSQLTFFFLALTLAAASAGEAQATQEGPPRVSEPGAAERFTGVYRLAGSVENGTRVIHRAIDHAVEPMNVFVRAIAAGRLRDRIAVVHRIELDVQGAQATITFDHERRCRSGLGQWRQQQLNGRTVRAQIRERSGALVQLTRGQRGSQRVIYRLRADGSLHADFTVESEQLPRDVRYHLTYRRAGAR